MKLKILRQIFIMSTCLFYGIFVQCLFAGLLLAKESEGQNMTKSMAEINVSVSAKGTALKKVFKEIEKQTGFHFNYHQQHVWGVDVVLQADGLPLNLVLENIARQTGLGFKRVNSNVNVTRAQRLLKQPVTEYIAAPEQAQITGQVIEAETGEPLPGVSIIIKGTSSGSTTDIDGNYSLAAAGGDVLQFSYIGFLTTEITLGNQSVVNVALEPDMEQLEEVVVVGYGVQQKRDLTGSVARVDGKDLANIPSSRVDQTLQGRAPGVQVTQVSGEPGAPASIRIRGGNSIQGNNEPLWVIDGIIVGQDFDLNNINTNDIQSIEILKDATAVSIYGTRGANGVILVTTKSGKGAGGGKPTITFNVYSGTQSILQDVDFLTGPQHAVYSNEDAEFRGAALPFPDLSAVPDVNWLDQVTETAPITNVDLSIGGVSENQKINYYVSGNYFNQQGIIKNSGIEKYIFRSNLDFKLSDKVSTGFRLNLSRLRRENNKTSISQIFRDHLASRPIFDNQGIYTVENPVSASVQTHPLADVTLRENHTFTTNLLGSYYLEYKPVQNLTFRSTFSPEINSFKQNIFNPGALPQNFVINDGGDARINNGLSFGFINENTVSYSNTFSEKHELNLLAGFTMQTFELEESFAQAFQLSNDITGFNNISFGSNPSRNVIGSDYDAFQLVSWLGRANYVFNSKYLFTFVARVDGSSRFAPGNQYGFFPSAAVAWRMSEEPFIKEMNLFDDLKLRASYGISGSQAIPSFRTLALLNIQNTTFGGAEQSGVSLGRPENPELRWETTNQLDIGIEAAFLGGRVSFELDYYMKRTEDLLLNVQIPRQTGFVSQLQNLGAMQNNGLELLVNTVNVARPNFEWSTTLTLSGNRNEVVDLGGVDLIDIVDASATGQGGPSGRLIVGETAPVFVGVNYLGTWKSQEEIDASGQVNQDVGGPRFEDTNNDGTITEDDFVILGSPQPDFIYGLQNTINYKNWSLDFFIQGTYGNEVFNSLTQTAFFGRAERTKYAETLNRWSPDNPDSDIPRAGAVAALSEVRNNSEMIEDATHLRLKNVRLAWSMPVGKWGWNGLKQVDLYFSGSNLFILSDFRLVDPETSMFGRSNIAQGFSQGEYPSARILTLGVKVVL